MLRGWRGDDEERGMAANESGNGKGCFRYSKINHFYFLVFLALRDEDEDELEDEEELLELEDEL